VLQIIWIESALLRKPLAISFPVSTAFVLGLVGFGRDGLLGHLLEGLWVIDHNLKYALGKPPPLLFRRRVTQLVQSCC